VQSSWGESLNRFHICIFETDNDGRGDPAPAFDLSIFYFEYCCAIINTFIYAIIILEVYLDPSLAINSTRIARIRIGYSSVEYNFSWGKVVQSLTMC